MRVITSLLALTALLLGACVTPTSTPNAHPDDMSAAAHRHAAHTEMSESKKHTDEFDPSARVWEVRVPSDPAWEAFPEYYVNPTQAHLDRAELHVKHAHAHRAAAETLEAFEVTECRGFQPKTRSMCPLLGAVIKVENIDNGVRFDVASGVDVKGLVAHINCHFAVGRKTGRDGMPQCPLYLRGLETLHRGDGQVELTTSEPAAVEPLRARMRTHVVPQ